MLGMALVANPTISVKKVSGNSDFSADEVRIFVSGWHRPDQDPPYDVTISAAAHETDMPALYGLYRQDVFAATQVRISVEPQINVDMMDWARTKPHYREEYRYGIEYAKNLTTGEFVTGAIEKIYGYNNISYVYFKGSMVSHQDQIELGYYAYFSSNVNYNPMKAGDLVDRAVVDGLLLAAEKTDRLDFGANSPYGENTHYYKYHGVLFGTGMDWSNDDLLLEYATVPTITTSWVTVLSFDSVSYNSRTTDYMFRDYTARSNPDIDETPYFVTELQVLTDGSSMDSTTRDDSYIELRITFNGSPVSQGGDQQVRYYILGSAEDMGNYPTPRGLDSDLVANSAEDGHLYYLNFGIFRCYNFKVDMRVVPGQAMTKVQLKWIGLGGWKIYDEGT
jgi:hypothetical protein